LHLFLVETDPISADSAAFFLEKENFTVTSFFSPARALSAALEQLPDLIISEIILSGMSGLRLCQALKGDAKTAQIPVLVLTVVQAEERARAAGADGFLLKPADRATLVGAVRELLTTSAGEKR
jgi:DNA-binding response OmpR family regulator